MNSYYVEKKEQQTNILWTEDDRLVSIETFERKLISMLDKAATKYPDIVKFIEEDQYGFKLYEIPRDNLKICFVAPISEKRRQQLTESAKKNFAQKQ